MKFIKITYLFFLIFITYLSFNPSYLEGQEIKRVFFAQDPWPPYTLKDTTPTGGHAVEIIKEIFRRLDIDVDLQLYPWKRVLMKAEDGEIDGIMMLSKDEERERYLIFSNFIVVDNDLIWYAPEHFRLKWGKDFEWKTLADLKPYQIGVVIGNSYGDAFQKATTDYKFAIEPTVSDKQNFLKLADGRIDIFISSEIPALYIINGDPALKGKIKSAATPFRPDPLKMYMAFSKKSPAKILLPKVNKVIADMQQSGFIDRVLGRLK
ncbi:Solute-binding protein family 3 domain-containing protein, MltF-like [Desulfonema limicola]|uniref:Solute-binding protein family 3 domain-containing protein, MltF-like n=1 Tax=Desulfonema limicola TaxID=45656 RepID=A0A975GIH3_9BACT|nr:transporter substrate-binding domain-containing protein [Desulfonema limicola]QTA81958.1 Solute-binding protein family 3 domain-containing protein, MltF-like [Desulfonema limicola]